MEVEWMKIDGVIKFKPKTHKDVRGSFAELFRENHYSLPCSFVQDNLSFSKIGTVRGMHYQTVNPQAKLVTVLDGAIFDVALDVRENSPTFGQHVGVILTQGEQLFIPAGFAHGFKALLTRTMVYYKVSTYREPEHEVSIKWDDPALGIDWPTAGRVIMSEKDQKGISFKDAPYFSA